MKIQGWKQQKLGKKEQRKNKRQRRIIKQFRQQADPLNPVEGLKQLEEAVSILLAVHPSERIPVQVLKQFLAEISKTFIAVTSLYEREKEFQDEKTQELIKLTKLKGQQRRALRVQEEMENSRTTNSDTEGEIVANQPQLREGLSPSSEQQLERISKWMNRVLEQRTDWP